MGRTHKILTSYQNPPPHTHTRTQEVDVSDPEVATNVIKCYKIAGLMGQNKIVMSYAV